MHEQISSTVMNNTEIVESVEDMTNRVKSLTTATGQGYNDAVLIKNPYTDFLDPIDSLQDANTSDGSILKGKHKLEIKVEIEGVAEDGQEVTENDWNNDQAVTKEVRYDIQEVFGDIDQEVSDNKSQRVSDDKDQETSDDKGQGVSEDKDQEMSDDKDQGMSDDKDQEVSDDNDQKVYKSQEASEDTTDSQEMTEQKSVTNTSVVTENTTEPNTQQENENPSATIDTSITTNTSHTTEKQENEDDTSSNIEIEIYI